MRLFILVVAFSLGLMSQTTLPVVRNGQTGNVVLNGNLAIGTSLPAGNGTSVSPTAGIVTPLIDNLNFNTVALPSPGTPVLTGTGSAGDNSGYYQYVVLPFNGVGHGVVSGQGTMHWNPVLNGTNWVNVATPSVTGSAYCLVYRITANLSNVSTGMIANVACGTTVQDKGISPIYAPGSGSDYTSPLDFTFDASVGFYSVASTAGTINGPLVLAQTNFLEPALLVKGINQSVASSSNPIFEVDSTVSNLSGWKFKIMPNGSVAVRDYAYMLGETLTFATACPNKTILCLSTDLSYDPAFTTLAVTNSAGHHDFLHIKSSGAGPQYWDTGTWRWKFLDSGLLAFGDSVATNPALKPNGTTLESRLGDDSAYAPIKGSTVTATVGFVGNLTGNASTATSATSSTSATTATNLAGGGAGYIPHQSAAGATAFSPSLTFTAPGIGGIQTGTATDRAIWVVGNTTETTYVGTENSTGTGIFSTGGLPYAASLMSNGAYPLQLGTQGVARITCLSDGKCGVGTNAPTGHWDVVYASGVAGSIVKTGDDSRAQQIITNSTNNIYVGVEGSSGGGIATGTTANAAVVSGSGNFPLQLASNAILRETIPTDGGQQSASFSQPTCDSDHRGTRVYTAGGAGVKDKWAICLKDSTDAYAWYNAVPLLP